MPITDEEAAMPDSVMGRGNANRPAMPPATMASGKAVSSTSTAARSSVAAHDPTATGLPHGTTVFTLRDLAERMEISRQNLHSLLTDLATSVLHLLRQRGKGRFGPWLFRFVCCDEPDTEDEVSTTADISPYTRD
jgi:hypothetical protein